ncbi:hypothetical protein [uncultured Corynebacterium sp.]|uniref:hypothetical protein n=1 Tax=uncultured Corynebacterium sp. TaxID=159447 RepID=UPI0025D3AF0F|nr:hypothetical protein [uncultured Corynebacterium sp.]
MSRVAFVDVAASVEVAVLVDAGEPVEVSAFVEAVALTVEECDRSSGEEVWAAESALSEAVIS